MHTNDLYRLFEPTKNYKKPIQMTGIMHTVDDSELSNRYSGEFNKKYQSNLGRAASPPLMAENNYATKSPLVTMGYSTFTLKTLTISIPI